MAAAGYREPLCRLRIQRELEERERGVPDSDRGTLHGDWSAQHAAELAEKKASMSTREERVDLLDWTNRELPISTQAELLDLNRTGLYYRPVPPSPEEVALKHRIDEIYTVYPFYGSRRITAQLRREGRQVSRKAVQRHMREMGLSAVYPGPNLSRREGKHGIHPYLLRGISITRPNQVWGIDITYIRLLRGWMYLVAIMDWYSRYVVAWEMDQCLEVAFVIAALGRAFTQSRPEILNSDQGSQFTSEAYIELLHTAQVQISMDGRGRAIDNILTSVRQS